MIEFHRLEMRNFLSIGTAQVDLMNQGLVLIEGENLDDPSAKSNGAGKSSIVDAIAWCLYGITAKGVRADSVVNLKAGVDCQVALSILVDKRIYQINRYRKHHKYGNKVTLVEHKGGVLTHHTAGTDKLTQQRIEALLGCDAETFNASIYMGQESMVDLPALTDKALKQILQSAMGLDRLDHAALMADAALANGYKIVDVCAHAVIKLQDQVKHAERMRDNTESVIETSRKTIKAETILLEEEKDSFARKHNSAYDAVEKIKANLTHADESLNKTVNVWTAASASLSSPLKANIAALGEAQMAYKEADAAHHIIFKELEALLKAQKDGACQTCKRPHDGAVDLTDDLATLKAANNDAADRTAMAKLQLELCKAALNKCQEEIESKTSEGTKVVQEIRNEIVNLKAQLHAQERYLNSIVNDWDDRLKKMAAFIDRLKATQRDEVTKVKEHYHLITKSTTELSDSVNELNLTKSKLQPLTNAAHALSRKGFRGEVFDQITPYLNARTQYYLDTLTEGNITATWITLQEDSHGNYQEKFHIEINHKSGVDQFAMLSGGEKRKVRLATALALQDLVATRAIKPIRLFVADEIDNAIDAAGLELLMGVLEQKARDVGTVFIISHNPIADLVRNNITVQKKDGVSTIKRPE